MCAFSDGKFETQTDRSFAVMKQKYIEALYSFVYIQTEPIGKVESQSSNIKKQIRKSKTYTNDVDSLTL